MGIVIKFPKSIRPVRLPSISRHQVRIRVIDSKRPREARWYVQWIIQCAAGFPALNGFNTAGAMHSKWHNFTVKSCRVGRLISDSKALLLAGRVQMTIDGQMIRPSVSMPAFTGKLKRSISKT
jgi:hypothetical protein